MNSRIACSNLAGTGKSADSKTDGGGMNRRSISTILPARAGGPNDPFASASCLPPPVLLCLSLC